MTRCKQPCVFNDCGRPCMEPKHHSTKLRAHACCSAHAVPVNPAPSREAPQSVPPLRWRQFRLPVVEALRAARTDLARAGGMAQADGMQMWSERAFVLAQLVQDMLDEIHKNEERAIQEACR